MIVVKKSKAPQDTGEEDPTKDLARFDSNTRFRTVKPDPSGLQWIPFLANIYRPKHQDS